MATSEKMRLILNLINEEIQESSPQVDTTKENEVRALSFKYTLKNTAQAIIRLESDQQHTCGNENCTCQNQQQG